MKKKVFTAIAFGLVAALAGSLLYVFWWHGQFRVERMSEKQPSAYVTSYSHILKNIGIAQEGMLSNILPPMRAAISLIISSR